ncbi:MAG: peptide chain release factor N(5)-glutamine methyltransferase [Bacteroidetes bacterium]|nr:peptide chain release factor N(5)-glutamine methyltransferase [Bacteroidota bacterium]
MDIRTGKLGELQALMKNELGKIYPEEEAKSIVNGLILHKTGKTAAESILEKDSALTESEILFFQQSLKRLKNHEPLQYITGLAHFYGFEFEVDPSVLIPRPETEELLDWIIKDYAKAGNHLKLLDIGTGSGCIAITLKKTFPDAEVWAVDVSGEAIVLAADNAERLKTSIIFEEMDILDPHFRARLPEFNMIVSNPPYVTPSDLKKMRKNVTAHEPPLALFVEEKDPLIFYREIIVFSTKHLVHGGHLYFECNESNALEVVELLKKYGFKDIELRLDMRGKERMVRGRL